MLLFGLVSALRFDIPAAPGEGTLKCFKQFVLKNTHVQGFVDSPNQPFQTVEAVATDDSPSQNILWKKPNVINEVKFSFTVHEDTNVKWCFTNTLDGGQAPGPNVRRQIYLRQLHKADGEILESNGAGKDTKFEPLIKELEELERISLEILGDLNHFELLDEEMQETNEAIKARVATFGSLSTVLLIGAGAWQVYYLYSFFRAKHLL
ncbi:emp24/gp25L/p24 family/GOLD-domain-containing protein [Gorgonomyces haynaldii]|nr:emp24/gp25L/p24 family/GOLD-domain-containing protein [Gorgonomyces haynaldii]